ncbi:hypothetical protein [Reichenbachiella sp. MSK19-1]|uniref:hypothetical protein n=1 Tax=Reichenbachiella sp. MSK19-1 TaxID=1897631 RepID=UPI000E6B9525|nr:hypothetical protein [Reichenbachiella sp. MSK19-1]RJE71455.1 hypothetical protein BGP76_04975 [Reichenbachiella sp. MSK19-1]
METLALTSEDVKSLKKQLIRAFIFSLFVVGIFTAMYTFVLSHMHDDIVIYVFAGFGMIFMGIIAYMAWTVVKDIKGGLKHRISGKMTDKRLDIHTSNTGSSSKGKSSTRTTRNYYIYLDGEEYKVDYRHYAKARVGDLVVMDRAPKSKHVLMFEVRATAASHDIVTREPAMDLSQLEEIELPLHEDDRVVMKQNFWKQFRSKLIWMTPFLFIIYGLLSSDMWGVLVFMFPLVIIPSVQFFRLCHSVFLYMRSQSYGQKVGMAAIVLDKSTITSNRSSTLQRIHTTWRSIDVNPILYDRLSEKDKIIVFRPKYGKKPFSLTTADDQMFYLG